MRRLLALLSLLLSPLAFADKPVLLIEESGYFLLRTVDGTPVVEPISSVLDRRGNAPDNPPTPEEPSPNPDLALSKTVMAWAKEVNDPAGAQALALVYHMLSEENLPVETGIIALREASNAALFSLGVQEKWEGFREKTSLELTTRRQQGLIATPKQLSNFMLAVAIGIENAADGKEAIDFASHLSLVQTITTEIDKAKK